jgi:hypothetical protein
LQKAENLMVYYHQKVGWWFFPMFYQPLITPSTGKLDDASKNNLTNISSDSEAIDYTKIY